MAQVQYNRDYNYIKNKLRHDYNVDIDENTIKEYEESVLKTGGNGVIISNTDLLRRYIQDNCGWALRGESKNVIKFEDFFKVNEEGGTATATTGNVSGGGAVITSTPSSTPGSTMGGSDAGSIFGGDGIVGSGDIGTVDKGSHFGYVGRKSKRGKKKKQKKQEFANQIGNVSDYIKTSDAEDVMSFTEFKKKDKKK